MRLPFNPAWCLVGLGLAAGPQAAVAADPAPLAGPRSWTATAWTSDNGLPENTVHALLQDARGYLWVVTYGGLVRFDGVRHVAIDLGPGASPTLGVYALAEDGAGGLWIGTAGGGLVHRAANGTIRHLTQAGTAGRLPSDSVRVVTRTSDGALLAGTDGGLVRVRGDVIERVPIQGGGSAGSIRALLPDTDSSAWVGSAGTGLLRYDGRELRRDPRVAGDVTALSPDGGLGAEGLFVGIAGGGVVHLPRAGEARRFGSADGLPDPVVKSLLLDRGGALWIGMNGGGLARLEGGRIDVPDLGAGLRQVIVQSLLQDREGLLWVGTLVRGLHRLRPAPVLSWTPEHGLPHPFAKGLALGRDGLWVATNGGGLAHLRDGDGHFEVIDRRHGLASDILMTVHEDARGRVFAGSYLKGLDRIEGGRVVQHWSAGDGLPNDTVTAFANRADGALWVGTYGGGLALLRDGARLEAVPLRDAANEVVRTLLAHGDELWVGTNDGLGWLRGSERRFWTTADGLGSNVVTALHRDADGTLWIGGRGGGLARLRDGRIATVRQRDGLHHDTIYAILDDGAGFLWCSSEHGLFRVARSSLEDFFAGRARAVGSIPLGKVDGLPSPQCSGGFGGAGVRTAGGRLYFPTIEGLAAVDPGALPRNPQPPPAVIEELSTEHGPHPVDAPVVIEPGHERLEIRYTGLALGAPDRVRFRFRLAGYDESWVEAGARRTAYYTRVPPGDYLFEVVALNEDGVASPAPASLAITLKPRFHQTRTFLALSVLAAAGLAWGSHRLRLRALQARERELEAVVAERTESLAEERRHAVMALSALETTHGELEAAHVELSRINDALRAADGLKSEMLGIAAHDLKNPLTVVRGFAELLAMKTPDAAAREMATRILRSADTMLGIVTRLLDSAALESGQLKIARERVDLAAVVGEVIDANRSQAERKQQPLAAELAAGLTVLGDAERLAQVVDNLLGNAIKYSPAGRRVRVRLTERDSQALLAVEDEGPGFAAADRDKLFRRFSRLSARPTGGESSSGLGLSIVKQLAELHGGAVDAHSPGPGQGATFELRLPLAPPPAGSL